MIARDEKQTVRPFEMFRFEVRPEALLRRIELSQARVQRRDQSPGVVGVKRFRGNRDAEVAHFQKDRLRDGEPP